MTTITYLHLSDLHFESSFEQDMVTNSMLKFVGEKEIRPDFVIITGDIAKHGKEEEYHEAEKFCQKLLETVGLEPNRLYIVPGNHDVDRAKVTPNDIKLFRTISGEQDVKDLIEDRRMFSGIMEKFGAFNDFAEKVIKNRLFDTSPSGFWFSEIRTITKGRRKCKILLAGLNSCLFAGYDGDDKQKLALGLYQVVPASERVTKDALSIVFFHHPFVCFHSADKVCQNMLIDKFDLILTGHMHEAENVFYRSSAGQTVMFAAGAGFESRESPNRFNVAEVDPISGKGRAQYYKYLPNHNRWKADTDINPDREDGCFLFEIGRPFGEELPEDAIAGGPEVVNVTKSLDDEIRDYGRKARSLHETLPLAGFTVNLRVPIRVEGIYVPLRAMLDVRLTGEACFSDATDAEEKLGNCRGDVEISVPEAFKEAEKRDCKGIVILGDPGSGKTTHLKRVLLWCLDGEMEKLGLPDDMVPVFLPLRELKECENPFSLDDFICRQLDNLELGTAEGFGKELLKRGNLLFLLDGLDEVSETADRALVSRRIEQAMRAHPTCRFVVTCRYAGYTNDARLNEKFLEMHIRPMTTEQAGAFIRNWYRIVKTYHSEDKAQAAVGAAKEAEDLIERLRRPEFRSAKVFAMTRNPLLLTNICLVHLDRGNLPYTRAALYEACTEVLLQRWRGAVGIQTKITLSGRRVLQAAALWMHQKDGRTRAKAAELAPHIDPVIKAIGWKHGTAGEFLRAAQEESGLLTGWDQVNYGFMHLGFQEYLTAREIQNRSVGNPEELKKLAARFGESWWREVILLMLALENPALFEPFMHEVVKLPAFADDSEFVGMCLDDSVETSPAPFFELLDQDPGNDKGLWKRQLSALKVLERIDPDVLKGLAPKLRNHPFKEIGKAVRSHIIEEKQRVIRPKPSEYELVFVPGGTFLMGSPKTEKVRTGDEGPQHAVTVPDFYMGRYPVTNEEYGRFLEANSGTEAPEYWADSKYNQPRQPVVGVSWHDAQKFAAWAGLRLPSEAEWEYTCRAKTRTRYHTGDSEKDLKRAGWYHGNSGSKLHPVGEKEPNALGLYDMHGNVWEWCEDDWHGSYEGAPEDGSAWIDKPRGSGRVLRGGSWDVGAVGCRAAYRDWVSPDYRNRGRGFRLVLLPGQQ